MPLEALLIPVNPTNSDYDGINGGTGCNFIFFYYIVYLEREVFRAVFLKRPTNNRQINSRSLILHAKYIY